MDNYSKIHKMQMQFQLFCMLQIKIGTFLTSSSTWWRKDTEFCQQSSTENFSFTGP